MSHIHVHVYSVSCRSMRTYNIATSVWTWDSSLEKLMSYPQEMLPSMAPSPTPNGYLTCTQTLQHTHTHTHGLWHTVVKDAMCIQVSGCAVAPFRCHNDRNQCSDQKVCRQHACLTVPHLGSSVCVCWRICERICMCACVLLIPRGWGWEKQVRKQQNKLRDNEESNTGTCFPPVWRAKNPCRKLHCLVLWSNDATDNCISRYFSPTECTISPLSPLLTLHKHALFLTHMHTFFFGFSYVARCPSWHSA